MLHKNILNKCCYIHYVLFDNLRDNLRYLKSDENIKQIVR